MVDMGLTLIAIAGVLATGTLASSRCNENVLKKSIAQAQEECVQYLNIPRARLAVYNEFIYPKDTETQRMVRCVGINLGWWNDTNGVQEAVIRSYFHPDPEDCLYDRRTYHCLKSQRLDCPTLDPSARAYESFRCYYEQYGNIVTTPQFVPFTSLQLVDVMMQCDTMLQQPDDAPCTRIFKPSERYIGCLLRCFLLRTGLYSEHHGPNLDRLYVQCNNYANETLFRERTTSCYRHLKSECLDECTLVRRFVGECFDDGLLQLIRLHINTNLNGASVTIGVTGNVDVGLGAATGALAGSLVSGLIGGLTMPVAGVGGMVGGVL
ncbi:general odorant-binding protein 45-like [Anopheles nili]|uniref:general odorant-binding protein 45-like n=1 Tax=Anopheles nili TaxID=185578 RepID=UPI00237BE5C2|nr:general odorant-binding protein 45-like [Anopheles nili]